MSPWSKILLTLILLTLLSLLISIKEIDSDVPDKEQKGIFIMKCLFVSWVVFVISFICHI